MVTHNPELAQRAHRQIHIVDGQIDEIREMRPVEASGASVSAPY
jgi:ABC-type lipoprotein export system ATPase subunit